MGDPPRPPQFSADGKFYWDGQRWQPANPPESPVAPAPLSPDGMWWWDGQHWQPTELHLSRLRGQPAVHPQIKHPSGSSNPVVAGLFGCLSIGMILLGAAAAVLESNNHSVCASGTGQLAQAFSQSLANQCAVSNTIFYGGVAVALLSAFALLVSLLRYRR